MIAWKGCGKLSRPLLAPQESQRSDNEEVLPTFWGDNFITLFPDEKKTKEARFAKQDLGGPEISVVIDNSR
ncbi:MAG TPA: hypothetical protein VIS48_04160 [Candidatus Kryptonia bacterium]